MSKFVVSARKYRPLTFDQVVGQEQITKTLLHEIESGKLAQAFLFSGPRGVGKTTCARILAKLVNEKEGGELEDYSFNIFELDAASNNSVDDVRQLIEQTRIPPQVGKYKVYIIDEVHMLSTAAFNAFLKTLEEPPPYAIFILATTEKHKILPTILSRCQQFNFNRIGIDETVKHLEKIAKEEKIETDNEALFLIAEKADGALRDALSIFDQLISFTQGKVTYNKISESLNVLDYDYFFDLTDAFIAGDIAKTLTIYSQILDKGFENKIFISDLAKHLRNLLVCRTPKTLNLLKVSEKIKSKFIEQSKLSHQAFLVNALSLFSKAELDIRTSRNERLFVEILLIKVCHLMDFVTDFVAEPVVQNYKKTKPSIVVSPKVAVIKPSDTKKSKQKVSKSNAKSTEEFKPELLTEKKKSISPKKRIIPKLYDVIKPKSNDLMVAKESKTQYDKVIEKVGLEEAWMKIANYYAENQARGLAGIFRSFQPTLINKNTINIVFNNVSVKEMFDNEIINTLKLLKEYTALKDITFDLQVDKSLVKESKPYTDIEIIEYFKKKHPNFEKLEQVFKLKSF